MLGKWRSHRALLITDAAPSADSTLVFGATETRFVPGSPCLVATSICDAIAAAPVLKALHPSFSVDFGFITTLHPSLTYRPAWTARRGRRRIRGPCTRTISPGRASVGALIPKPTTVVAACERIVPELAGRLKCMSFRVPTACVSSGDMTLHLERDVTEKDVLGALEELRRSQSSRNVVRITDEPLVSVDYLKEEYSCIIDTRWLMLNQRRQLKVVLWYDNEWGYSSRVADAIDLFA